MELGPQVICFRFTFSFNLFYTDFISKLTLIKVEIFSHSGRKFNGMEKSKGKLCTEKCNPGVCI
jgi:hypothetical protein